MLGRHAGDLGRRVRRTPYAENREQAKMGRDHHHTAFSMLLGRRRRQGGCAYGSSDELGMNVAEQGVHVHDLHAHHPSPLRHGPREADYRYAGRDFRLTDVYGEVVKGIIA
jgi:hypothetical protein